MIEHVLQGGIVQIGRKSPHRLDGVGPTSFVERTRVAEKLGNVPRGTRIGGRADRRAFEHAIERGHEQRSVRHRGFPRRRCEDSDGELSRSFANQIDGGLAAVGVRIAKVSRQLSERVCVEHLTAHAIRGAIFAETARSEQEGRVAAPHRERHN